MLPPVDSGESKFYGYIKSMFATQDAKILKMRSAGPHLPRNMAALVEKRRKARVDRSRMIANNQEYQRNILDANAAYHREDEIMRLSSFLATPARGVSLSPTVIHAGNVTQNIQASLEAAALKTSMDSARVQLNKLILAQEEYHRPLARLRRMDVRGNPVATRRR